MSLPKWAWPVAIVAMLALVLALSSRDPKSPEGLPVIDSNEKLISTVKQSFDMSNPIVARAEKGQEPTQEEQKKLIEAALMLDSASRFAPLTTNLYVGAARNYYYAGQLDIAEARARQAIDNNKFDKDEAMKRAIQAEAFYNLSLVRFKLGDYDDALNQARQAVKLDRNVPNYLAAEASALIQLGKVEEADNVLHEALSLDPEHYRSKQLHGLVKTPH